MSTWELIITGSGTSHGSPMWGVPEHWSEDPRDHRRRSGAVLRGPDGQVLLFDCGPDLAHQMTDPYRDWDGRSYPTRSINRCDGVLLTHDHADHCHGINDLRHLNRLMHGTGIVIHGHDTHLASLRAMFPYCFVQMPEAYHHAKPSLSTHVLVDGVPTRIAGIEVTAFAMGHGPAGRVTGFRCGGMAWLTDVKTLPAENDHLLQGLDLLAITMLRDEPHPTHCCWAETQAIIARLRPQRSVLIHMSPDVHHAAWVARLPAGVTMAYDGWHSGFPA